MAIKKNYYGWFYIARVIFPFIWNNEWSIRARLIWAMALVFVTIALEVSVPLILKYVIQNFSTPELTVNSLIWVLGAYGFIWTLGQVCSELRYVVMFRSFERSVRRLSLKLVERLIKLSLRYHLERKTGAVISAIERAQNGLPTLFWGPLFILIPTVLGIGIAAVILWRLYGYVYGLGLVITVLAYIGFSLLSVKWTISAQIWCGKARSKSNAKLADCLLNYETIHHFNNQDYELKQNNILLEERENAFTQFLVRNEVVVLIQAIIIGSGLTVLTLLSGHAVLAHQLNISDFVLINGYLLQFAIPLSYFGDTLRDMRKATNDMQSVIEILNKKPDTPDDSKFAKLQMSEGTVVFDKVSFSYDVRRPILREVSFTIPAGHRVAIVGPTGAGKSTISKLLFRFYEVTGGQILIDGQSIANLNLESLRAALAIVPQDTALFDNTLYYNIAYGRPDATREEVEKVVKMAHLNHLINRLPDGLETKVGERGLKISGGEKQRVAIARALLKNPYIYVFDEATSALDTRTERVIQKNLEEISQGATTLIIAHRLSTVIQANQILVLDQGCIVERGTHTELLALNGLYAKLWEEQQFKTLS
jgi:ABC-type transport system involved in Fe-S cluster assembly fused permease/ATPase subunit